MTNEIQTVRIGLAIILIGLFLGVGMGISFGINEDAYKDFVAEGIAAHPTIHDENSESKIWRYAQRAHFHANGISAFSLGLVILVMTSWVRDIISKMHHKIPESNGQFGGHKHCTEFGISGMRCNCWLLANLPCDHDSI